MVQHLVAFGPALLVTGFFLVGPLNWPRQQTWARTIACLATLALALRYLYWRFTATVLPQPWSDGAQTTWVWFVFAIECLAFLETLLFMVIMSRTVDRGPEADRLEREMFSGNPDEWPAVDVLIPTYNEPVAVLERTIVGAKALDYPADKLTIYVLDDGRREWLRRFCADKDVHHVTRPDNQHAKAGNLNHGLSVSRGDFVAVFDADFVPYRNFLRRTLGFFADHAIGIVQTPQHFFNKDPIQSNLALEQYWPDEQRLFFDDMAASRDAWNVSFCCGSCSVLRREAITAIGGIPTQSITEDLLTTLACLNRGYVTRYLNERLSMGLAAEDLEGYFIQRARWCRGGIQTLFLANGPLFGPGLTLFQRIMFLPVSWLIQYVVRFVALIVPAVFLLTGLAPLYFTGVDDIFYFQLPALLAYFFFIRWIAPTRYLPILSTAVGAFTTFRMLPVVVGSVVRPFGEPFRVTPKGVEGEARFDRYTFTWIVAVIVATALGLIINLLPESAMVGRSQFSAVAVWWGFMNILVLVLASMICFEAPRASSGWFTTDERAHLSCSLGEYPARLVAISLEESRVEIAPGLAALGGQTAALKVTGVGQFTVKIRSTAVVDATAVLSLVHQQLPATIRDELIRKLYTGSYHQTIDQLRFGRIVGRLWVRAFGRGAAGHDRPERRSAGRAVS